MALQDIIESAANPNVRQAMVLTASTLFNVLRTYCSESANKNFELQVAQLGRAPEYPEPLHRDITMNREYNKGAILLSILVADYLGHSLAKMNDNPLQGSNLAEFVANTATAFVGFCLGTVATAYVLKKAGFYNRERN